MEENQQIIVKNIQKEINDLWENELKENANKKMEVLLNNAKKDLKNILNKFTNDIHNDIEKKKNEIKNLKQLENLNKLPLPLKIGYNQLINAVLIILSSIDFIKNYSIFVKKEEPQNNNFYYKFIKFVEELWTIKYNEYDPIILQEYLNQNIPKKDQNDLGKIFYFILSKIKEELNPPNLNIKKENISDSMIDFNEEKSRIKFKQKNSMNNKSIFDSFFSDIEIIERCPEIFDIRKFRHDSIPVINIYLKCSEINNLDNNDKELALLYNIDLKENFHALLTNNDTKNQFCKFCNKKQEFIISKKLKEIDKILIINVNRENDKKYLKNLNYDFKLKYSNFSIEEKNGDIYYQLISVIMILKTEIKTYFLNLDDNNWYLYTQNGKGEITQVKNLDEIINVKYANILIYERIDN